MSANNMIVSPESPRKSWRMCPDHERMLSWVSGYESHTNQVFCSSNNEKNTAGREGQQEIMPRAAEIYNTNNALNEMTSLHEELPK